MRQQQRAYRQKTEDTDRTVHVDALRIVTMVKPNAI